jgi:hypothetical protein
VRLLTKLSGDARDPDAGFQVVAGRPDDLQRLMVVSGRRSTGASDGPVHVHLGDEVLRVVS